MNGALIKVYSVNRNSVRLLVDPEDGAKKPVIESRHVEPTHPHVDSVAGSFCAQPGGEPCN